MSDNDFTMQFAIQMPNGELYKTTTSALFKSMFGVSGKGEGRPMIWDTRAEAEEAITDIRARAANLGYAEWFGVIVQRLCTPFTLNEPATHFVSELQAWLKEQNYE